MSYYVVKCETLTALNGKQYNAPLEKCGVMNEYGLIQLIRGFRATGAQGKKTIYTRNDGKICYEVETM